MSFTWNYPIYLVSHGGGLASIAGQDADGQPFGSVAVFTQREMAAAFIVGAGIEDTEAENPVRLLENDREFAYLLSGLRPPVTAVVFDPSSQDAQVAPAWQVNIETLLQNHLPLARSPWDYPVYAIGEGAGYASIIGRAQGQDDLVAMGLFTTIALAEAYRDVAQIKGRIEQLDQPPALRRLLGVLGQSINAVALDPTLVEGRRTAKWCVDIATLLEKYLPEEE
jgi:hypothetical protein